jgi:hypothetical protein
VFGFGSLGFPDGPQWAYSFSNFACQGGCDPWHGEPFKVVWVWDQSNGKQIILVSMDTHMYKQCISMKLKKKECSRLSASGCRFKGDNSIFSLKIYSVYQSK